ncbi:hypothetical protein ANANG_G00135110 [Anguilla anguilla]|uniref:PDZ domain-containing protein n=1 Tax=Anguilla anguilla TaxID=7936 RepID=A0A9D3RVI5_ANGAN|nr:hypothetical protein ANANG_G00135110 [Anguilla anguilla]
MRSARMVTADYICITVRGGAPWGFSLQGGGGDLHEPLRVSRVDKGGHAALAGLCEGDEVVSLNGRTCSDLTLADAMALMDSATDRLSLLVKRYQASDPLGPDGDQRHFGVQEPVEEGLESTTLQIWPRRELYISESQDEAYYGESESDPEISAKAPPAPANAGSRFVAPCPGAPGDPETRLRSAPTTSPCISSTLHVPISSREPLGQRGEVEVTLQGFGRGRRREEEGEEVRPRGCVDPQAAPPAQVSFSVSSSEGAETADQPDTESEGDPSKPSKHRARHATNCPHLPPATPQGFRRSESLSEKQVKEAKSKCKRIALLLTAAPNPNSKGVLMFKRRRQRAKKYTLVSYGTGETEPEESDEEDEAQEFEFTLLDATESGLDEDFLAHAQRRGHILTLDWDTGLLEIEKKLDGGEDMECLPDTKGKGALMFAKRRQRVDEITAEHEEMRRKGLPVEAMVPEAEAPQVSKQMSYQVEEHTYVQSPGGQVYMDLNSHAQAWTPTGSGEQIASRDERISVPAIKTGILQETRRRNASKPMFTFKEAPKVSPNPELLNLLNRQDKKPGFESEEDYLSLGAEACNFLQSTARATAQTTPTQTAYLGPVITAPSAAPVPANRVGPQPNHAPASAMASAQNHVAAHQPAKSQNPPERSAVPPPPPRRMNSYTHVSKALSESPAGPGPAFGMPALRGKGAELFAKRQSRMENSYVVPKFPVPSKAEPAAAGVVLAAPKPKFSAKKSAAQVWKPAAVEQE